jgi:holo-[acyl-carrier protein] synthase
MEPCSTGRRAGADPDRSFSFPAGRIRGSLGRNDYGVCMITLPDAIDASRVRIGCDVVEVEDVQDSLAAFGDRYLRKIFTASEINDCRGSNRLHRLAARFAAKEAVIKAFAEPDAPFPWREIEVTKDGPLPLLRLSGALAERAQDQGWLNSSLSLSHADCHAMAVVLVVCSPAESR